MVGNCFFLIEPRPNLVSHLRGKTEPDFIDILSEPVLIRCREGCRAGGMKGIREAKVKLLFLARLREYDPLSSDAEAARLLGDDRISTALFDRWWTIREFGLEDDADDLVASLVPVLDKIDPTGSPELHSWLEQIRGRNG